MQLDRTARLDEPPALSLTGLPARRPVRIEVSWPGSVVSSALYDSGDAGAVDTDHSLSEDGDYLGRDPYGLWWSGPAAADLLADQELRIRIVSDRVERRVSLLRKGLADGVEVSVPTGLPTGVLFTPADRPAATVIVLGGSGGGSEPARTIAGMLSARGARALGLAFFGVPGLPAQLAEVPIETVGDAVELLAQQTGEPVHLIGISRGAELALQVAARYSGIATVTALAPSMIGWPGLTSNATAGPAWTWNGEPLPYAVPGSGNRGGSVERTRHGLSFAPLYQATLDELDCWRHAEIAVGGIAARLLLVSGGDDRLWPSGRFAELARQRRPGRDDLDLHFPEAGHGIGRPPGLPAAATHIRHPVTGLSYDLGGTRAANAAAGAAWWKELIGMIGLDPGGLV